MKKHLKVLLAGALVIVPLAITLYVIVSIGTALDSIVNSISYAVIWPLKASGWQVYPGTGVILTLAILYLTGILTKAWGFRTFFSWLDQTITRLPGIKTIYESIRDLMKLFGGDSKTMGKAVIYRNPKSDVAMLGIMTNDAPAGITENCQEPLVAVYLPLGYMFGGIIVYVPKAHLKEIELPVDSVLKLSMTANVGTSKQVAPPQMKQAE